jgi:hypothetical protein
VSAGSPGPWSRVREAGENSAATNEAARPKTPPLTAAARVRTPDGLEPLSRVTDLA